MNKTTSQGAKYPLYEVSKLLLDPQNPRLQEYGVPANSSQDDILRAIWERMAAEEVAMSIAYNGYFSHEPLFIERRGAKLFVIEGNRRLCAVKILLSRQLRRSLKVTDLPNLTSADRKKLSSLPGIATTRRGCLAISGVQARQRSSHMGSVRKGPVRGEGSQRVRCPTRGHRKADWGLQQHDRTPISWSDGSRASRRPWNLRSLERGT